MKIGPQVPDMRTSLRLPRIGFGSYSRYQSRAYPGRPWAYASFNTMLPGRIVEAATGKDMQAIADAFLFGPLGITSYQWERA